MILAEHPTHATRPQFLGKRAIGYWRAGPSEPELPDPRDFCDPAWDPRERARVVAYLKAGELGIHWRGLSECRLCHSHNGARCLTDEAFVWPEGFAHYLEAHHVRPPIEFVQHVLGKVS